MSKKNKGFDKPTLSKLAKKAGVAVDHLRGLGWFEGEGEITKKDGTTFRVTGCRIPYYRRAEEGEAGAIDLGGVQVVETFAKVRASLEGSPKYLHERPGEPGLYGEWLLDEYRQRKNPSLILEEGETDLAALTSQGLPAAGIPGVDTVSKVLRADHLEGFNRLFVIREPGEGGETFCKNLAKHLPSIGWTKPVTVVDLGHDDSADMLCELHTSFLPAFRECCKAGVSLNRIAAQSAAQGLIKWASTVKMQPVRFVLAPYIPIGYLTLLAGDAGLGKSTGIVALASAISRGQLVGGADPEMSDLGEGRTLVFTGGEDLAEETVVPRYLAAGGDPEKLAVVDEKGLTFDKLDVIGEVVAAVKPALIVFDPLLRFWPPGLSMNDQDTAGPILEALCDLARDHNAGLMPVLWAPKGKVESGMDMFFGSVAFRGLMRSGLVVQAAEDDDPRNQIRRGVFSQAKCNVAPLGKSFGYEISSEACDLIEEEPGRFTSEETEALRRVGSFRWLGIVEETADQIAERGSKGSEGRALIHAKKLIKEALEGRGETVLATLDKVRSDHAVPFPLWFTARLDLGVKQRTDAASGEVYVWLPGEGAGGEEELDQMVF